MSNQSPNLQREARNLQSPITTIILDLGGVIVELDGQPIRNEWTQGEDTPEESWRKWLTLPIAKAFDRGEISADIFATQIVTELNLSISPTDFKDAFEVWPIGLFDGAIELLTALRKTHTLAFLSNINELHYDRCVINMGLKDKFDHEFASNHLGLVKPDASIYEHVIDALGGNASEMLFLDDNQLNVDAARRASMQAEVVKGVAGAEARLRELGLL